MFSGIFAQNPGFLAGLDQIQNRISRTNQQITSGTRVHVASDDPAALSQILGYQQQIDHITQVQANLNIADLHAKTADGALQSASQLLDQLVSIGAQAANSNLSGATTTSSGYAVDSAQAFTPPLGTDTETLTFTAGSGSASVNLTAANAGDLQTAITTINGVLSSSGLGITAVASSNTPGGIAFQNSGSFSVTDQLTGATGDTAGVFRQTVPASGPAGYTANAAPVTSNSSNASFMAAVEQIQQQLVALANTSVNGRYIFGGDNTTAAPYSYDGTGWGASANYTGSTQPNTSTIGDINGQTIIPIPGAQQVFDNPPAPAPSTTNPIPAAPPAGNVFAAVGYLRLALQNNDQSAITTATALLHSAVTQIGQASMTIGNTENWIDQANSSATQALNNIQQQLSTVRDTDIASAATQLTMDQTALQAAIAAHASLSNKSLFDYIG